MTLRAMRWMRYNTAMRFVLAAGCLVFVGLLIWVDAAEREARAEVGAETETATKSGAGAGDPGLAWGDAVRWYGWEEGLGLAKSEGKAVCLVVYADWCERCEELAPVFSQPGIAAMARGLVMVRQDQDEAPGWLRERFGEVGNYVPRVLFLDADGNLRADIQSGHPRYPYFYSHHVADRLLANMHTAARGG